MKYAYEAGDAEEYCETLKGPCEYLNLETSVYSGKKLKSLNLNMIYLKLSYYYKLVRFKRKNK